MEHSEATGSFLRLFVLLILLPDLLTDALILTPGKLVAQLVDDFFQMLLQRFVFQVLVQRIVPALVKPDDNFLISTNLIPNADTYCRQPRSQRQ